MTEPTTLDDARSAKLKLSAALAGDPQVNGIGLGYGAAGYVLKVNVTAPEAADRVPSTVDGVTVHTEVVGTIRPL